MEMKYDPTKVLKVAIDDVRPNPWNPKEKNHKKVEDIKTSIKTIGFKEPVQVRDNDGLEIIDGEQRWTAMKELGADFIYVYNNGKVSDEDAKSETLWWQVQVPFETIQLANLVVELNNLEMELPYSEAEIADFKEMIEFDFDDYATDGPEDEDLEFKTFTVKLPMEAFKILESALEDLKEKNDCSDARAIELMAADYISGS